MESDVKEEINESIYLEGTTINKGHLHSYAVDEDGDGETLVTFNLDGNIETHIHNIEKFKIKEINEHVHFLKLKIEEKPEEEIIEEIKERRIILNTGETGIVEFITDKIEGKLYGIIIESGGMINVEISLEEFNDVTLYEKQGFSGTKYLSLRNDVTFSNNERAQGDGAIWILKDRLRIRVEGGTNSLVGFIVRYK